MDAPLSHIYDVLAVMVISTKDEFHARGLFPIIICISFEYLSGCVHPYAMLNNAILARMMLPK